MENVLLKEMAVTAPNYTVPAGGSRKVNYESRRDHIRNAKIGAN